jgi:hypothetical protein
MKVTIHEHALLRMKERGATRTEVEYAVKNGAKSPAKYGRSRFTHRFVYNRKWLGKLYRNKTIEAYAARIGTDEWLVVTVIVLYS